MNTVTSLIKPVLVGVLMVSQFVVPATVHAQVSAAGFGQVNGQAVELYTLTNGHGVEAQVMTYGATIVSLKTPDRAGAIKNIVLGFDQVDSYVAGVPYFGATIGRYANRIAHAKFKLDGAVYQVPANDGLNSLHGGNHGFDKQLWKAEVIDSGANKLRLTYVSANGEEGYPGQVTAVVTYRLGEDDLLEIRYDATTTAPTPINLANHTYFNLTGDFSHNVLDHTLQINAESYTPVDNTLIPTGELRSVVGTPFDFRSPMAIGKRIGQPDQQLTLGHGYDHNWVLTGSKPGAALRTAAVLADPQSGRVVEVRTTQPGLQFYSGNFMDGKPAGAGSVYQYRTGLCLETQHFPDSPNRPSFPNSILRPGERYSQTTVLSFRTTNVAP